MTELEELLKSIKEWTSRPGIDFVKVIPDFERLLAVVKVQAKALDKIGFGSKIYKIEGGFNQCNWTASEMQDFARKAATEVMRILGDPE